MPQLTDDDLANLMAGRQTPFHALAQEGRETSLPWFAANGVPQGAGEGRPFASDTGTMAQLAEMFPQSQMPNALPRQTPSISATPPPQPPGLADFLRGPVSAATGARLNPIEAIAASLPQQAAAPYQPPLAYDQRKERTPLEALPEVIRNTIDPGARAQELALRDEQDTPGGVAVRTQTPAQQMRNALLASYGGAPDAESAVDRAAGPQKMRVTEQIPLSPMEWLKGQVDIGTNVGTAGLALGAGKGGTALGAGAIRRAAKRTEFPEWAAEYPPAGGQHFTYEPKTDFAKVPGIKDVPQEMRVGDERFYKAKQLSPEGEAVDYARSKAQKAIGRGEYTPYYDVSKRADVDPSAYPATTNTLGIVPKTPALAAEKARLMRVPDPATETVMPRLREAYEKGRDLPHAKDWYFVKQLEDEFVKEYGPTKGREMFRDKFAGSMAQTTGGSAPGDNFRNAMFVNYLKQRGEPIPESWELPVGVGGRYGPGTWKEAPYDVGNPKRHNFMYNFLGHADRATIDEQMTKLFFPAAVKGEKKPPSVPAAGNYGLFEQATADLAKEYGVDPRTFQEVAWAGGKHLADVRAGMKPELAYQGAPMMQTINEAIERTSRVTGLPPAEVVRRGIVRSEMPIYSTGPGPASVVDALTRRDDPESGTGR